jgi:hypothetical protein
METITKRAGQEGDPALLCVRDNPDSGIPSHEFVNLGPGGIDGRIPVNFYACPYKNDECLGRRLRNDPAEFIGPCALGPVQNT